MADQSRRPYMRGTSGSASGTGTLSWSASGVMGSLYVKNRGTGVVFFNFTTTPPAAATVGTDKHGLGPGDACNLDDIEGFTDIAFRCDASGTFIVEAIASPRPGSSGQGVT